MFAQFSELMRGLAVVLAIVLVIAFFVRAVYLVVLAVANDRLPIRLGGMAVVAVGILAVIFWGNWWIIVLSLIVIGLGELVYHFSLLVWRNWWRVEVFCSSRGANLCWVLGILGAAADWAWTVLWGEPTALGRWARALGRGTRAVAWWNWRKLGPALQCPGCGAVRTLGVDAVEACGYCGDAAIPFAPRSLWRPNWSWRPLWYQEWQLIRERRRHVRQLQRLRRHAEIRRQRAELRRQQRLGLPASV